MSVEVVDLVRRFGDLHAVNGLSLVVQAGEIYGLLGANGAGKTTALRMMAGLLLPTSGSIHLAGVDVVAHPETAKARLGFATASAGLYPRLTPRELFRYVGAVYHVPQGRISARITELSQVLGLEAILDRRCEGLSTGQRQRVSLGRAVFPDPPVLILDEPTAGLDIVASRFLRDFVLAERARGKSVILSTHYLTEAELLCDRVGLMHQGRLLVEGTPTALRAAHGGASLEEALLRLVGASPGPDSSTAGSPS